MPLFHSILSWLKAILGKTKPSVAANDDANDYLKNEFAISEQQLDETDTVHLALAEVARQKADVAAADASVLRYRISSATFTDANLNFISKSCNLPI